MFLPKEADWSFHGSLFCLNEFWNWSEAVRLFDVFEAAAPPEHWENSVVSWPYD